MVPCPSYFMDTTRLDQTSDRVEASRRSAQVWMVEVEDMMRLSVRHVMHLAILDYAKQERTVLTQREK